MDPIFKTILQKFKALKAYIDNFQIKKNVTDSKKSIAMLKQFDWSFKKSVISA